MNNIDRIMYLIHSNRTKSEQQEGIDMAREVGCLQAFFQPMGPSCSKGVWENCAIILCERSDDELMPYLRDMLLWLEDLNWPGAERIQQRLIQFSNVKWLSELMNEMVPALFLLGKRSWLLFLAELMENVTLNEHLSTHTRSILIQVSSAFPAPK